MLSLVVPFRGAKGKSRLVRLPGAAREALVSAMLDDVVSACTAIGQTFVVGPAAALPPEVVVLPDPGGGQGAAVRAGLEAASLLTGGVGPFLVVNADLPCVTARDLLALAGAVPDEGLALAPAADGTTNALALSSLAVYAPVYGPGSAKRFAALGPFRTVEAPNLIDDVDTTSDLDRLRGRLGPRTRSVLTTLRTGAAA
jgi:2-phospho-L-lactate guanylyltransferase